MNIVYVLCTLALGGICLYQTMVARVAQMMLAREIRVSTLAIATLKRLPCGNPDAQRIMVPQVLAELDRISTQPISPMRRMRKP